MTPMKRNGSRLGTSASALALFPILGMLGGILFGLFRGWILNADAFTATAYFVRSGFVGSVLGAVVAVAAAVLERGSVTSLKKLMVLIAVAAVLLWVVITLLGGLAANGTL
jgi:hypothetical protein